VRLRVQWCRPARRGVFQGFNNFAKPLAGVQNFESPYFVSCLNSKRVIILTWNSSLANIWIGTRCLYASKLTCLIGFKFLFVSRMPWRYGPAQWACECRDLGGVFQKVNDNHGSSFDYKNSHLKSRFSAQLWIPMIDTRRAFHQRTLHHPLKVTRPHGKRSIFNGEHPFWALPLSHGRTLASETATGVK
jgi:hypothetical protein